MLADLTVLRCDMQLRDALADARRDCATWRAIALAAVDALHAQQQEIERQRRQIADLMDERKRYAREVFGRTPADE